MHKLIINEAEKVSNIVDFSSLENRSVLITGATGLVGLFLVAGMAPAVLKYNIKITVWVNNPIPSHLQPLFDGCGVITGDITDPVNFKGQSPFDCIIHAAGYGQPIKFVRNRLKTILINTDATVRLFGLLKPGGSFLFISSSEIYNGLETPNITENMMGCTNTDHFRSCYIEGKKCGESICLTFAAEDYNIKIARLSLAYGPGTREDDERVINTFVKKGLAFNEITMLDHGTAIRTYCYITDAVIMLWNILLKGKHPIYNVGGTSATTIAGLANTIGSIINKPVKFPDIDKPLEGNPKIVNISCDRYKEEFGDIEYVTLKEGVEKVVEWYKILLK